MTEMDVSDPHAELYRLSAYLKALVAWDQADDAPGYPLWTPSPVVPSVERPSAEKPVTSHADTSVVGPSAPLLATQQPQPELAAIQAELGECERCKLSDQGRTHIVFGEGNPDADLLFAGEGPGYHEDQTGRPFVGKGGALLDKMIEAMGLDRSDVYICNVVKCRPPNNRDPEPDEVLTCQPFLRAQIRSVRPRVIVTLGRFATQCLLESTDSLGRLRGVFHEALNAKVMPTYHPAYLLRNPADKRKTWADLQQVMRELGLPGKEGR